MARPSNADEQAVEMYGKRGASQTEARALQAIEAAIGDNVAVGAGRPQGIVSVAVRLPPSTALGEDPVDVIVAHINDVVARAHKVALDQCEKARQTIEQTSRDALVTIDRVEAAIQAKREGTTQQFASYMEAIRSAQISAEDICATTAAAIATVDEAVGKIGERVKAMPAPAPTGNGAAIGSPAQDVGR